MPKKDPNKPRGRMTGYAYFVQTCREEHKTKHPDQNVVFLEFSKRCASRWRDMSDEEKKPFIDMTEKDKVRYEREMQQYKANLKLNGGGDTPKGKKQKKKKDPNAPKRPQSAFFLYCADHRASLKAANPGYSVGDVAKALGKQWQEVDEKLKKSYQEKGEIEKQKYNKVMEAYRAQQAAASQPAAKRAKMGDEEIEDSDSD